MKLKIGDKVKFLNEIGSGEIIKITDNQNVMIKDENGFEYPYPTKELIIDQNIQNTPTTTQNKTHKKITEKTPEFKIGDKVKFLNETGGGEIIKIIDNQNVMIKDENGFEYTYPTRELIIDQNIQNTQNTPTITQNTNTPTITQNKTHKKITEKITEFKIGDKVKFLNDTGGGEITKITDNQNVIIKDEDGFEYPYSTKELIIDQNTPTITQQKIKEPKIIGNIDLTKLNKENNSTENHENTIIDIIFVPKNKKNPTQSDHTLYITNNSNWQIAYICQNNNNNKYTTYFNTLQPNQYNQITTFTSSEISKIEKIILQIIFYKNTPYHIKPPLYKIVNLKPAKFFQQKTFTENKIFKQKTYKINILTDTAYTKTIKELKNNKLYNKKNITTTTKKTNHPTTPTNPHEIDLHIEKLLDDTTGMEAKDMLEYQIDKFKKELASSQKNKKIQKIIFIHGKGNGQLKAKIRTHLDQNKIKYQDASFKKYGFGATLVFI